MGVEQGRFTSLSSAPDPNRKDTVSYLLRFKGGRYGLAVPDRSLTPSMGITTISGPDDPVEFLTLETGETKTVSYSAATKLIDQGVGMLK